MSISFLSRVFLWIVVLFGTTAWGSMQPLRRVVVFPFQVENELSTAASEAWWDVREKLTDTKQFLVASKNFMEVKDVFQPRAHLVPSDAIILGRVLDCHAIVTAFVKNQKMTMTVYETQNGLMLWRQELAFHPSRPASKQLLEMSRKLIFDFVASVPFQGVVQKDAFTQKVSFQDQQKTFIRAEVGVHPSLTTSAVVHVMRLKQKNLEPQYQGGADLYIFAEGEVVSIQDGIALIQLRRIQSGEEVREGDGVRFPAVVESLKKNYSLDATTSIVIGTHFLTDKMVSLTDEQKKKKPLVTALSFIGHIVLFLLLAF